MDDPSPPSRRETSEAQLEAEKIVQECWTKEYREAWLIGQIAFAFAQRDIQIANLKADNAGLLAVSKDYAFLTTRIEALRGVLAYGIADDEPDDPETLLGRWRIQARSALEHEEEGSKGN